MAVPVDLTSGGSNRLVPLGCDRKGQIGEKNPTCSEAPLKGPRNWHRVETLHVIYMTRNP